jgi:quercetin dioxygenase-like cupin family protein
MYDDIYSLRDNLERLKVLSEQLDLAQIATFNGVKAIYKVVGEGECYGIGLLKNDDIAVQDAVIGPRTILLPHDHREIEFLIVYEGDLTIHIDGEDHTITKGHCIIINPGIQHIGESNEGCKIIGITVPGSKGYPDGRD